MKRIISFLFVVLIAFSSLLISISATELPTDIRTSAVLDDLSKMDIEGRQFNEKNYPENVYGTDYVRVLSFLEYGYDSKGDQSDYGLYIYIYNPKLKSFALEGNKIQIAVGETEETVGIVRKYPLVEVSRSPDYRFIKYRVSNFQPGGANAPIYDLVKRDERIYQVSGIELKMYGSNANAKEYEIGGTYIYTGFMKGHGSVPGASSTLYCNAKDLLTIELDIRGATWRSETSSVGLGHKNEIASVYFGIDQSILDNYSYLYRVEGEFYENKIGSVVTTSEEFYSYYKGLDGTNRKDLDGYTVIYPNLPDSGYSAKYPFFRTEDISDLSSPVDNKFGKYDVGFNHCTLVDGFCEYEHILDFVPYFFYVPKFVGEGCDVSSKEIIQRVSAKGLFSLSDPVHVNYDICFDSDPISLHSYKSDNSWWDYMFECGGNPILSLLLYGSIPRDDYSDISPLASFDSADIVMADSALSDKWFISKSDISDFRKYVNTASLKKQTVHILRFSVSDYYARNVAAALPSDNQGNYTDYLANYDESYYAEQTYYDDFDILRLTFMDENGNKTPFAVSANPVDVFGGIENTPDYDGDENDNGISDWLEELIEFLKKLFGFILVALLIVGVLWLIDKIFAWINGASISATLKKSLQSKGSPTKKRKRK